MTNPAFKWKHFAPEIILWCLRWYGSTPMSYANLSDMLAERGVSVNRSTIYCWFMEYAQHYARSYVAINSSEQILRGSSMKPTSR
ncbi:Mobile element protein [Candidatus Enterovibrio altilux]|uniref:Mobile element protein n=1 Tax=Candidatus Enterovibrio altilux TaxID=1927128 RepID=A0A291B6H2_9GAMM|nr:Mobile element protein [Candidatus Enterovibrio luxaltus]